MSKRTSRARVSYVEVDSDVDIASSDDEAVQGSSGAMSAAEARGSKKGKAKGQGRMRGALKPSKKTRDRLIGSSETEEAGKDRPTIVWNVERLLNLPVELLLEIVSQLDMSDLIHLASTSRSLRQLFVSRSGGKFWAATRKKDAYNLPDDMSEIEFGLFLAGTHCEYCGATSATSHRHLRVRTCSECEKNYLIAYDEIRRTMPHLHRDTLQVCRRKSSNNFARIVNGDIFVYDDLCSTSDLLEELEDQDDQARAANQSSRGRSTKSRRNKLSSGEQLQDDALSRYITSELKQRRKERELLSAHNWTQEQLDFWHEFESYPVRSLKPKVDDPSQDPEDKFDELDWQDPRFDAILPSWIEFKDFDAIKALWHPEDAQLDDTTWDEQELIVEQVLIDFAESTRILAIRSILAATSGKPLSKIPSSPAKYPRETYDEVFFTRPTSLFGHRHPVMSRLTTRLVTYSTRAAQLQGSNRLAARLSNSISHQQVLAIRIVMEAACVNSAAASKQDLDDLQGTFVWTDGKGKVWKYQSWMDMVHVLMNRAALVKKKRTGEKVEVEFKPVEENADTVDDGADDDDDGGGSSEPEDGEADEDEGEDEDKGAQEEGENENDADELDEEDEDDDA
ncbi:hypothetical protein Rhopal_006726-T1 [Rhodotorula paludigena]|uniref:F-box domain-containing protein n=1 Tax=Rhodotorula paludigena TaxID=86838 RepID=A0AAV5GT32_9BASI|nr:hypothetical protein Rhopal_006726-T1 [Rhodotorula paludigena]